MIVYTGTHDNETIKGWLEGQPRKVRLATERELYAWGYEEDSVAKTLSAIRWTIRRILRYSQYRTCWNLIMREDEYSGHARTPNWEWRLVSLDGLKDKKAFIRKALAKSGRVEEERCQLEKEGGLIAKKIKGI